jgi:hypothetical protein
VKQDITKGKEELVKRKEQREDDNEE